MTDIVNLKRFRKRKDLDAKQAAAEENRAKFGRTKAEKQRDKQTAKQLADQLDGNKLDKENGD